MIDAHTHLVAKAIGELAHELLIEPRRLDVDEFALATDAPEVEYRFRAHRHALDHWVVDRSSLRKTHRGQPAPIDGVRFFVELRARLGIPEPTVAGYLEEVASTLHGAAWIRARGGPSADALTRAGFQEIETAMCAGHPVFVAGSGRIGFSARDHAAYAPEAGQPLQLAWLAAHARNLELACVDGLTHDALLRAELGEEALAAFTARLPDPEAYRLIPVHPWQWDNRIAQMFAPDLARGDLIFLGHGADRYLPQQSIRTLANTSRPDRCYVKTALSIRNMGFTRGLPARLPRIGAAVNDWASALVRRDPVLAEHGFGLLREIAFVGYHHRTFERASSLRSDPYKEMLGAVWRESPLGLVRPGQRLMTMAALLHVDGAGAPFLPALIRASGLDAEAWVRAYLRAYLTPLLHCFYAHDLVFTPHCENVILVLEHDVPVGAILKDLAEDIGVINPSVELPAPVRHLGVRIPEENATLSIFVDVFDGVFRFLAPILAEAGYAEERFWRQVAACVHDYRRAQPQVAEKLRRLDLFAPTFQRSCLNRLQLTNHRLMIDLNAPDPFESLQFVGTLPNPIAPFREATP